MLIVSCDTSHRQGALALVGDGKLLEENSFAPVAELLVVHCQELLKKHDLTLGDIDLFAVTLGPGSFTGLRIGLTVIKTLAHLHHKPAVGVSTLAAMALTAQQKWRTSSKTAVNLEYLLPVIHASSDDFYYGVYPAKASLTTLYELSEQEKFVDRSVLLANLPKKSLLFGAGVKPLLSSKISPDQPTSSAPVTVLQQVTQVTIDEQLQSAAPLAVALLAAQQFQSGHGILQPSTQPRYLRLSEAERKRGVPSLI